MASGRAILAPATPDIQELLVDRKNALLAEPDKVEKTAALLKELYEKPALLQALGAAARKSGEELTWDARAQKFLSWITKNPQFSKQ